jgi:hypothetical protein
MAALRQATLEVGVGAQPLPGESVSGDRQLLRRFAGGTLIAVIDAIGHGAQAERVAELAAATLEKDPAAPAAVLMRRCHERLRATRGAALALARIERRDRLLSWVAVGNVYGLLLRAAGAPAGEALLVRGGLVGGRLPALEPQRFALGPGDTLIVATDGIERRFSESLPATLAPQEMADWILRSHARADDDALVLVARHGTEAA